MNKRNILTISFFAAILVFTMTGCKSQPIAQKSTSLPETTSTPVVKKTNEPLQIVTTLFPQYDFAKQIVGDKANVTMLLPAGVDTHSYDPTPTDIININNASLFIYTGETMEAWAKKIIDGVDNKSLNVLDVSKNIRLEKEDDDDKTFDPHIWTDPNNAIIMVDNILNTLCTIDPVNASYYKTNAENYKKELQALDISFRDLISKGIRDEIVFGGRNPFYYFLERYDLDSDGPYKSCAAETEPSAREVASVIKEIKDERIPVIYYEELSIPAVAKSIAAETGVQILPLHSAHNVSKEDYEKQVTYVSLMKENIENLRIGLY